MGIYTAVKKLLIEVSTDGASGTAVTVEYCTNAEKTKWNTLGTYQLSGWSGWNSIPLSSLYGFGSTSGQHKHSIRLTFSQTAPSSDTNARPMQILSLCLFGDGIWSTPSNMARHNHIYNFDYLQNVTFPASLTAPNIYATNTITAPVFDGKATYIQTSVASASASYYLTFVNNTSGGRAYVMTDFSFNPSTEELKTSHLRLRNGNENSGSYLRFGDGNYACIYEDPDDYLNINTGSITMTFDPRNEEVLFNSNGDTTTNIKVNPSSNTIYATNFEGTASKVNIKQNTSANSTYYLMLTNKSAGSTYTYTTTNIKVNPSSNTITASIFDGKATYIQTSVSSASASYYLTFVNNTSGGRAYVMTDLSFNPSTEELKTSHLRLRNGNENSGSYLRFGNGDNTCIYEDPDDSLNIHSVGTTMKLNNSSVSLVNSDEIATIIFYLNDGMIELGGISITNGDSTQYLDGTGSQKSLWIHL